MGLCQALLSPFLKTAWRYLVSDWVKLPTIRPKHIISGHDLLLSGGVSTVLYSMTKHFTETHYVFLFFNHCITTAFVEQQNISSNHPSCWSFSTGREWVRSYKDVEFGVGLRALDEYSHNGDKTLAWHIQKTVTTQGFWQVACPWAMLSICCWSSAEHGKRTISITSALLLTVLFGLWHLIVSVASMGLRGRFLWIWNTVVYQQGTVNYPVQVLI